jgi:alpha-L-rhamnosidase
MNKIVYVFLLCITNLYANAQHLKVDGLTCEYLVNPLGVEASAPKLSWKLQSGQHDVVQTAYQILVSDNLNSLQQNVGNIWDSKKINASQSLQLKYLGKSLLSSKTYFWKVRVWDNKNNSAQSSIAHWQMGLLTSTDWKGAKWIADEKMPDSNVNVLPTDGKKDKYNANNVQPLLRKDFLVGKKIKKATAFISGLGHFEMSLNGSKVGQDFLAPGWTKYDKEALYVTYDITSQLKSGKNAIGIMLGNGFYYIPPVKNRYRKLKVAFGYPKMICRIVLEYQDGTRTEVISDHSWKTTPSPITFSSIYGGEDYNANLEQKGWDSPNFNATGWKNAIEVSGPPLHAQKEEPVKFFEQFLPKTIKQLTNVDWIYDLGQNTSGIIELVVSGKKGDTIRIIPAELLKVDGSASQQSSGGPAYFNYVLKGDGMETWRPKFTYYGFRYLQVKGGTPDGKPKDQKAVIISLKGLHIRNAAKKVGEFNSSSTLFNQTFDLINWAIKSNMVSVFTDCPHREKLGWLEQVHLMGSSVRYNYDIAPLLRKSLMDMKNSQTENGLIPEIAPEYVKFEWGGDMFRDSPEWGSSIILVPWYLYQWYGDQESIAKYYPTMQRYINYLGSKANNHILSQGLGDWYDLGPKPPGVSQLTPMGITATAIYYHDLKILEEMARMLGKNNDSKAYHDLAIAVKTAFNTKFFNPVTNQYGSGSQAANAMAVYMELVDPLKKTAVVANIVKDIRDRNNSLTAGDIGYRYLLRVLENEGLSNVVFDMNSRSDVPGYGIQLAKGATALTESWSALPANSNNHFMLGHLMEWFYSGVGGIRQEKGSIAFSKIKIYPEFVGDLTTAKAAYQSPYGLIATNWTKTGTGLGLEVSIPANTTANIYLPVASNQKIFIDDKPLTIDHGLSTIINGRIKIAIGSGNYKFKVN